MNLISQYEDQLKNLQIKYASLLSSSYTKRNFQLIECIEDEIKDLEFALSRMRKFDGDMLGYRPRRDTLLTRADFYKSV